ncbi:MAG: Mut7-C RNAse domain-containing protein [Elusimicrobia bacterium]|nr:Mut7-C RNAse domain-containing protein [Elusimicrobiota bacterium]
MPKFLVDGMLGQLAKWLIMLGYDAKIVPDGPRAELDMVIDALREGRVLLTRDTKLAPARGLKMLVLREQHLEDQLAKVLRELGLKPDPKKFMTRCTLCNQDLVKAERKEVLSGIPPKVRKLRTMFHRCPSCGKLYWRGTHVKNAKTKLSTLFSKVQ